MAAAIGNMETASMVGITEDCSKVDCIRGVRLLGNFFLGRSHGGNATLPWAPHPTPEHALTRSPTGLPRVDVPVRSQVNRPAVCWGGGALGFREIQEGESLASVRL